MTTIKRQCDSMAKHGPHEWLYKGVFRRQCPGRLRPGRGKSG